MPLAREELKLEADAVTTFGPAIRRELAALAQAVARRHVMPWLDTERICEEQGADVSHLPRSLDEEHGFRTRSRFYFHDMITIGEPPSPLL